MREAYKDVLRVWSIVAMGILALVVGIQLIGQPKATDAPAVVHIMTETKMDKAGTLQYQPVPGKATGTGFHIGNGKYLTAAHVVKGADKVTMEDAPQMELEVLWRSDEYDVALMKERYVGVPIVTFDSFLARFAQAGLSYSRKALSISCAKLTPGTPVTVEGFPLDLGRTITKGVVSGTEQDFKGYWKRGVVVDVAVAPGNSGSPMLDQAGSVAGIVVGSRLMPIGFGATITGFNIVVPSSVLCDMNLFNIWRP